MTEVCIRAKWLINPALICPFLQHEANELFLLPPGWDASPSQGSSSIQFAGTHLYNWVNWRERHCDTKCLAQEHNTMSPARVRTHTSRFRGERTNHKATTPPQWMIADFCPNILRAESLRFFSISQYRLSSSELILGKIKLTFLAEISPKDTTIDMRIALDFLGGF